MHQEDTWDGLKASISISFSGLQFTVLEGNDEMLLTPAEAEVVQGILL